MGKHIISVRLSVWSYCHTCQRAIPSRLGEPIRQCRECEKKRKYKEAMERTRAALKAAEGGDQ